MVDLKKYPLLHRTLAGFSKVENEYMHVGDAMYEAQEMVQAWINRGIQELGDAAAKIKGELKHWERGGPRAAEVTDIEYQAAQDLLEKVESQYQYFSDIKLKVVKV